MHKILFPLVGLAWLTACPPKECDTDTAACADSDTGDTMDTTDTMDTDDTDVVVEEFEVTYAWATDAVTITLANTDATGFYYGAAETASAVGVGWYGEACDPDNCHEFTGLSATLDSVDAIGDIEFGSTTLFDNDGDDTAEAFTSGGDDRLTYIVALIGGESDGDCFTWGGDPSYYTVDGCTEITAISE